MTAIETSQINAIDQEFRASDEVSPMVWRSQPEKEKTPKDKLIHFLAPKSAISLKFNNIDESKFKETFGLEPYIRLYKKAQDLIKGIEETTGEAALEVLAPMLNWFKLDDLNPDDITVNDAIKRALGLYAFRKSIHIVASSKGAIKGSGIVREYMEMCKEGNDDEKLLIELVKKVPILGKPTKDVVQEDGTLVDRDGVLNNIDSIARVDTSDLIGPSARQDTLARQVTRIINNFTKGVDLEQMWINEGLNNRIKPIPVLRPTMVSILTLARFQSWLCLIDRETAVYINDRADWENDRDSILGIAKYLPVQDKQVIADELKVIERGLFKDVD